MIEGTVTGQMEQIKQEWKPPVLSSLPHKLNGLIAFDLETKDDGIQAKQGPSWPWADGGHVVGYSFCADNWSGYIPINHEGGGNVDPVHARDIVKRWLGNPLQCKIGANVLYDLGWSKRDGIEVKGKVYDVQWAEALMDEYKFSYSLDSLAKAYLNEGKDEGLLREKAAEWGLDAKAGLWKLPAAFVGPYATADADRTRRVFLAQVPKLKEKGLWDLFEMECSLLPLYLDMRWRGIRIDTDRADQLKTQFDKEVKELTEEIHRKTGIYPDLWAAESLSKILEKEGIPFGLTAKTKKPSITADWLEEQTHWLPKMILAARRKHRLSHTFIDSQILGNFHHGRIHCEFHPLRGEEGGTKTGRLSSSNPNLQQVPKRTEEGKKLRECFLPEEGEEFFSLDYSQQEPRLTVHYAAITTRGGEPLPGALEAVAKYQSDPKMSYHKMVAEQTGLGYDQSKILNLGIIYGMGAKHASMDMGVSLEEGKKFIETYHQRLPFVKALDNVLKDKVDCSGEFKTLLGRICRFPLWELADFDEARKVKNPVPYWKALQIYAGQRIKRAGMHKKLNRLIQGSAADQCKRAMLDIWNAGLGSHMLLQIHDELCFSFRDRKLAEEAARLMEQAVQLKVPVIAEIKSGVNWGLVK
jgi:DNA polymerase I-like protein with 3'-5' exonuclease and polymerase domains